MKNSKVASGGFTLVEMSIVLVIIGLIVGGVLVGQDLIKAAYVRAQITQIENYNTAINTFYDRFQGLPGDLNATATQSFGFDPNLNGDGDGLIDSSGICSSEELGFCSDLTYANGQNLNLIPGSYGRPISGGGEEGGQTYYGYDPQAGMTIQDFSHCWPEAKLGNSNFIVVSADAGENYYSVTQILGVGGTSYGQTDGSSLTGANGITVSQAYKIDSKVDDGLPQSGNVMARRQTFMNGMFWASGNTMTDGYGSIGDFDPNSCPYPWSVSCGPVVAGDGVATAPSNLTCYDNGSSPGGVEHYSTAVNGGAGLNCSLSFKLQ